MCHHAQPEVRFLKGKIPLGAVCSYNSSSQEAQAKGSQFQDQLLVLYDETLSNMNKLLWDPLKST